MITKSLLHCSGNKIFIFMCINYIAIKKDWIRLLCKF